MRFGLVSWPLFVSPCAAALHGGESDDASLSLLQVAALRYGEPEVATAPSALVEVVGRDGVLQLTLGPRAEVSGKRQAKMQRHAALRTAGIYPTRFLATDGKTADPGTMEQACLPRAAPATKPTCERERKVGDGCPSLVEQAIADSHRRALIAAKSRESNWTLILEDDVVPVNPGDWDAQFREAWQHVKPKYKMVRLGWCTFEQALGNITETSDADTSGKFHLYNFMSWHDRAANVDRYYSGGCTSAYMIHRDIIDEVLAIFPCCCPMDCCLEHGFFYKKAGDHFRGQEVVTNMDAEGVREFSSALSYSNQSGVLVQDNRHFLSLRPAWNTSLANQWRPP